MDRRTFLALSAALPTAAFLPHPNPSPIKAILFDAFPIFDPRSINTKALQLFPEKGAQLMKEWRTRQFEYTWLRSMSNNYVDFISVTSDALKYAGQLLDLPITDTQHQLLIDAWYQLPVWPEVPQVLAHLKNAGYRLGILSNFTPDMLQKNAARNQIDTYFEHLLSVDRTRRYKPDPSTYELGLQEYKLSKKEILFVPFAGWDAAGSKSFGYPTFWVNRLQTPPEQLGTTVDGTGNDLNDLLKYPVF